MNFARPFGPRLSLLWSCSLAICLSTGCDADDVVPEADSQEDASEQPSATDKEDSNDASEESATPEASAKSKNPSDKEDKSKSPEPEPEKSKEGSGSKDKDPSPKDDAGSGKEDGPDCGELPFDADWLKTRVSELSGAIEAEVDGKKMTLGERFTKEGREKGRAWIRAQYKALGYEVSEHSFSRGVNVVATKKGASDEFFVISAHHDTVRNCPGADDDAAGIVTNLAIAAALAPCDLEFSVRFVSFDQEENGLVGSAAYAKSLKSSGESKKMRGNLQVEMTAYDSDKDGSFNVIDCDDPMNEFLTEAVKEAINTESLPLHAHEHCTEASDHSSFWDIDVPAICVSELFFGRKPDRTPCYHQSCDKVDILNFDYMNTLSRGLAYASMRLVQAE